MKEVIYQDLQIIDYKEAWDYQESLFQELLQNKSNKEVGNKNYLLFCEHSHVFTLGKSGQENNLLIDEKRLKELDASFYQINRGGDITYHGYGQITGYPILDLDNFAIGLRQYIFNLEEVIIQTLQYYQIDAERLQGAAGVWLDGNRKICAIGVRSSRMITMHGFALNVNTDLSYFNYINPCGFTDKKATSMAKELGKNLAMEEVKEKLKENFAKVFGMVFTAQKSSTLSF